MYIHLIHSKVCKKLRTKSKVILTNIYFIVIISCGRKIILSQNLLVNNDSWEYFFTSKSILIC